MNCWPGWDLLIRSSSARFGSDTVTAFQPKACFTAPKKPKAFCHRKPEPAQEQHKSFTQRELLKTRVKTSDTSGHNP